MAKIRTLVPLRDCLAATLDGLALSAEAEARTDHFRDFGLHCWALAHPWVRVREFGTPTPRCDHALYRIFDEAGGLLYVGITVRSVRVRLHDHFKKSWANWATRIEVCYGYTRREALEAELASIRGEEPLYNRQGVDYGWPRHAGLNGWIYNQ